MVNRVHRWGSGASRLWLFHGFTGNEHAFDHLEPLLGRHFTAHVPLLPGHGDADGPVCFTDTARDLAALIEPGDVLAGYSMGARLALAAVLLGGARPRRLVLESGTAGLKRSHERVQRRAEDEALAAELERDGVEVFVDRWQSKPLFAGLRSLPAEQRDALSLRRRSHQAAGLADALSILGTGAQPNLWPLLPRLPVPLLCLTGARDAKFTALGAAISAAAPTGYHRVIDCGHVVHLERPADYSSALLDFATTAFPVRYFSEEAA
jgi:2-succinyl-6-hydroxy-2,4-cyclohexadiene-1-carboxylate synthase